MRLWILEMTAWITAVLIGILVHELGHALVFRYLFKIPSHIVLYAFGGLTIPLSSHRRKPGLLGTLSEIFLSFSGPLAGFLLATCLIVPLSFRFSDPMAFYHAMNIRETGLQGVLWQWCYYVIFISVVWGIFNLLPIYPLDGGQIFREFFTYLSPRRGLANSLGLSIATAVCLALIAFRFGMFFAAVLCLFFAYNNYVELTQRSFRRW